jgi:hypothetical protein
MTHAQKITLYVPPRGSWHEGLKCFVRGVYYMPTYGVGMLYLSPGPKPDMDACVAYFAAIDREVCEISVARLGVLNDRPSLRYRKDDLGAWKASSICYLVKEGMLFYLFGFFTDSALWRLRWREIGWWLESLWPGRD